MAAPPALPFRRGPHRLRLQPGIVRAVLRIRSIPARPPAFDRDVLRAVVFSSPGGPWPRTAASLAALVGASHGRPDARWVARPEEALLKAAAAALGDPAAPIAAPSWGRTSLAGPLGHLPRVRWMPPEPGRLDPDAAAVESALSEGARAVLLAPVAGDCSAVPAAAEACKARGALLLLDARASSGSRLLDAPPERFGDLLLLPVDGEPVPSCCPGAILCGAGSEPAFDREGPARPGLALASLAASLADEPRLRRVLDLPSASRREVGLPLPPPWAVAAASVRLQQSSARATQRALHARLLRANLDNLAGVDVVRDPPGFQSAGGVLALLVRRRDDVASALARRGIPALHETAAWLAPPESRDLAALRVAEEALFLPLHPFYERADVEAICERLRSAALGGG